jgi:nitrite reductase/ring-hydroxylating ferredoxin subunit
VLVCTGLPMVDRGFYFARLEPKRSYCIAVRLREPLARDVPMAISVDSPNRSVRSAPDPDGGDPLLIIGGEGHTVGREPDTMARYEALVRWAHEHFPVAEVAWRWSTQDYQSVDLLPFVGGGGPLPEGMAVATGFAKWGMTNGAAAGLALAERTLGRPPAWSAVFDAGRSGLRHGLSDFLKLNGEVAWHQVADRVATLAPSAAPSADGQASRSAFGRHGTACVDGSQHTVSAVCPHLGGVLSWNPAERSWDCPLHGSRFGCDGALLQGPAVTDLAVTPPRAQEA